MPCNDVTEVLSLSLDPRDRVLSFSLEKMTCGADVGSALVACIEGQDVQSIAALEFRELPHGKESHFLLEKQFRALQAAIAVYLGRASGAKDSLFTIETLEFGETGTTLKGLLRVDLAAAAIPACRSCACSKIPAGS